MSNKQNPFKLQKTKERSARNEGPSEIPFETVSGFLSNFEFHPNKKKDFEIAEALESQKYKSMQYLINQAQAMVSDKDVKILARFKSRLKGLREHAWYKKWFTTNP